VAPPTDAMEVDPPSAGEAGAGADYGLDHVETALRTLGERHFDVDVKDTLGLLVK
jgi:hypothetical protein